MKNKPSRNIKELPPRHLSLFTKLVLLFGNGQSILGWGIFGFGMIFVWGFVSFDAPAYWLKIFQNWSTKSATITKVSDTNGSINEVTVYQYDYSFDHENQTYHGIAFTTGKKFNEGTVREIEFNVNNPQESKMPDTRRTQFNRWLSLFVVIFPIIGLSFIYSSIKKSWKYLKLLKIGDATKAKMVSKKSISKSGNNKGDGPSLYNYEFQFNYTDQHGETNKYIAKCSTTLCHLVEDELKEIVLFDRFNPNNNIVFDSMESAPRISPDGYLEQAPFYKIFNLIIPAIAILGHGYYYIFYVLQ